MTQYVQYDEQGIITAVVISFCPAPDNLRQLIFEEPVDLTGKKVDIVNGVLVDCEVDPIPANPPQDVDIP